MANDEMLDHFAGLAMVGLIANKDLHTGEKAVIAKFTTQNAYDTLAETAFTMARAMLQARDRHQALLAAGAPTPSDRHLLYGLGDTPQRQRGVRAKR